MSDANLVEFARLLAQKWGQPVSTTPQGRRAAPVVESVPAVPIAAIVLRALAVELDELADAPAGVRATTLGALLNQSADVSIVVRLFAARSASVYELFIGLQSGGLTAPEARRELERILGITQAKVSMLISMGRVQNR